MGIKFKFFAKLHTLKPVGNVCFICSKKKKKHGAIDEKSPSLKLQY